MDMQDGKHCKAMTSLKEHAHQDFSLVEIKTIFIITNAQWQVLPPSNKLLQSSSLAHVISFIG